MTSALISLRWVWQNLRLSVGQVRVFGLRYDCLTRRARPVVAPLMLAAVPAVGAIKPLEFWRNSQLSLFSPTLLALCQPVRGFINLHLTAVTPFSSAALMYCIRVALLWATTGVCMFGCTRVFVYLLWCILPFTYKIITISISSALPLPVVTTAAIDWKREACRRNSWTNYKDRCPEENANDPLATRGQGLQGRRKPYLPGGWKLLQIRR